MPSKFLLLPVLLLLLATSCLSQNHPLHWKSWTTPVTDLKDIYFISEKEGWAIGESYFFRTEDGGKTWAITLPSTTNSFYCLAVFDSKKIKIFGYHGEATTNNGGKTWQHEPKTGKDYILQYRIVDKLTHYRVTYINGTEKSEDGGITWIKNTGIRLPCFTDSTHAWTIGSGKIKYSDDKCKNWQDIYKLDGFSVKSMQFIENTGWLLGKDNELKITTDGGKTFVKSKILLEDFKGFTANSLYFITKNKGWICGSTGGIIFTEDGGKSWKKSTQNTSSLVKEVFFSDPATGWLSLHSGKLLKTKNGGETWDSIKSPSQHPIIKIHFFNSKDGFLVDNSGVVFRTLDDGHSWRTTYPAFSAGATHVNAVQFNEKTNNLWLGLFNGQFKHMKLYSWPEKVNTNSPSTSPSPPPPPRPVGTWWTTENIKDILEILDLAGTDSSGYLIGICYKEDRQTRELFTYRNASNGWKRDTSVISPYTVFFFDAFNGWVVSTNNSIFHTSDAGKTWKEHSFPELYIKEVHFISPQKGIALGSYSLYLTEDGGASWTTISETRGNLTVMFGKPGIGYWLGGHGSSLFHIDE